MHSAAVKLSKTFLQLSKTLHHYAAQRKIFVKNLKRKEKRKNSYGFGVGARTKPICTDSCISSHAISQPTSQQAQCWNLLNRIIVNCDFMGFYFFSGSDKHNIYFQSVCGNPIFIRFFCVLLHAEKYPEIVKKIKKERKVLKMTNLFRF